MVPGIKVYGGSLDNVKGCTNKVENGDKVSLGADVNILALHTPWYGFFFLRYLVFCLIIIVKVSLLSIVRFLNISEVSFFVSWCYPVVLYIYIWG